MPWFVAGFALAAALRTIGVVSAPAGAAAQHLSQLLTIAAMAGLGLSVDARSVRAVGPRVAGVIVDLLLLLILLAVAIIRLLGIDG